MSEEVVDKREDTKLWIILQLQGKHLETLYLFIQKLIELDAGSTPNRHNLHYFYALDVTTVIFQGSGWLFSVGAWVKSLKTAGVAMAGWSNWDVPFLQKLKPKLEMDLEDIPEDKYPAQGSLTEICLLIGIRDEVDDPEAAKAAQKEIRKEFSLTETALNPNPVKRDDDDDPLFG